MYPESRLDTLRRNGPNANVSADGRHKKTNNNARRPTKKLQVVCTGPS